MKKELTNIIIEYTEDDLDYIDNISKEIEKGTIEIVNFLNVKDSNKIKLKLWNNLDEFRKYYENKFNRLPKEWTCGFAENNYIHVLSYKEYIKTKSHDKETIDDIKKVILHEFTHSCHSKVGNLTCMAWFSEGLAIKLSHQMDNITKKFAGTLDEMMNGTSNYANYHLMFEYVYNKYKKDYMIKLLLDDSFLERETPRLYKETIDYYK